MTNVSGDLLTWSTKSADVSANSRTGLTETCTRDQLSARNSSERLAFEASVRYICEFRWTRFWQSWQIGAGSGFYAIRFDERLGQLVQQIGAGSGFYAIRFNECLGQLVQQCASSTDICQICQHRRQVSRDIRQIRKRCVQVSRDICRNNQTDMQISLDICRICRPISHMHATSAYGGLTTHGNKAGPALLG